MKRERKRNNEWGRGKSELNGVNGVNGVNGIRQQGWN